MSCRSCTILALSCLASISTLLLGCGGGGSKFKGSNNSAQLTGAAVGRGTEPSNTARSVPITLTGEGFTGSTMYLARSSLTSTMPYVIIPVTNTSGELRCFVQTDVLDILGSSGTLASEMSYLTGAVGESESSHVYTDTCLGPGETSYVLDILDTDVYDEATGANVTIAYSSSKFALAPARIIPQSYESDGTDVDVTVTNTGTASAQLGEYTRTVYLVGGVPAFWTFLNGSISEPVVAPGASSVISDSTYWTGSTTTMVVFVDFDEPDVAGALTLAPSGELAEEVEAYQAYRAATKLRWQRAR